MWVPILGNEDGKDVGYTRQSTTQELKAACCIPTEQKILNNNAGAKRNKRKTPTANTISAL